MPESFSFPDPLTQPNFGVPPAAPAAPKPAAAPPRTAAASMLAPASLNAPVQFPGLPAPAPAAQPQQQQPATGGVDQFMHLVRAHESGGNDKASSGVADGRYQFTPATWAGVAKQHPELGLQPNDIWDGTKQDLAMRAISKDYVNVLETNGIQPSMSNMFMLHFLGTGGGPKFLKQMQADPNANAAALFPLEAEYNPTIFHDKAGQPRSLQQVYALMTKTFGGPPMNPAMPAASDLKGIDTFDKAAGAPTAVRGFTDQAQQPLANEVKTSLEEAPVSGLKPLPGMTPIKPTLKPLPGMTPISDGLKIDYNAKEPLKPTGGHTDENGNYHPAETSAKSDAPAPEVIGVDPTTGMPVFADPKLNAEEQKGELETAKGFAAGVAQDVTGPASLLPNSLGGGYAEKANEYLDKTGDPAARVAGNIAPMAVPAGEIFGAAKAGAKALEAGESLLPSFGKAVGTGAATGALSASSNPTGKEGYGERLVAKAPGMLESGAVGGMISGAVPGVGAAAQWIGGEAGSFGKFITDAFGKEAKKAAEELRSNVNAKTGEALTAEEKKVAEAKVEEAAAKANQSIADAKIKHLDEQQEKLRNRMQDRVKTAQSVAERAGQNVEQAKAFAADQERAVVKAEESATKLAENFANRPTMRSEEFGAQLQETAVKDAEALKAKRAEESGFNAAVKSDGGKPSIPTKQFISAVNEAEKRAVSGEAKATLAKLKTDLKQQIEGGKVSAVSTERARRIVQELDGKIDGLPSDEAHELTALKERFVAHMEEFNKPLRAAREKYAELSRPLDVYRDTGALAKSVLEDPYSGRVIQDSTKTVGALLNKTEASADALGRLIKTDPKLQDSARKFFNQKLVDVAGKNPTPSEAQFANFLRDNRLALDRAGLTNEFKDLAASKTTQERIAREAKSGVEIARKTAGEAEKVATGAERDVNAAKALKDRAAAPSTLKAQRAPAEEARAQSVKDLASAASKQKAANDVKEHIAKLENKLDPSVARTGQEITQEANKTADYLLDKGYLDPTSHKEMLAKIREVEQMNLDHAKAARLVKQIIIAGSVAALGGLGAEAGHFISHRVTP